MRLSFGDIVRPDEWWWQSGSGLSVAKDGHRQAPMDGLAACPEPLCHHHSHPQTSRL